MKKTMVLAALLFPAVLAAKDVSVKDMPDPMAKRRLTLQRPDGEKLLMAVSAKLKLSSRQQERILEAMKKETKKFDKMMEKYKEAREQEKKWRFKMNEIRHQMLKLNMNIPEVLRQFLDEEQREMFDTMIENSMAPKKKSRKRRMKRKPPKSKMGKVLRKKKTPEKRKKLLEIPEEEDFEGYYP